MATLYAKAAGGNWSAAGTWSATGSGGGDSAGPPTSADNVIFEAGSGNVTIDASGACRSLDCTAGTGNYAGTLTHNTTFILDIGDATPGPGNVAWKFTGTYTPVSATNSLLRFSSTSATVQTVDFGVGTTTGNVQFQSGGSWQLTRAWTSTATSTTTLSSGTLDLNNQTISWGLFNTNNSNNRTIVFGTANVTITGTGTSFNMGAITGLTCSAASSTITISGAAATFSGSGQAYGTVNFTGTGQAVLTSAATGTTISTLTRTGTASKLDSLALSTTVTCTNITFAGNSVTNRISVVNGTVGSARYIIYTNTPSISNCDFQDIFFYKESNFNAGDNILRPHCSRVEISSGGWSANSNNSTANAAASSAFSSNFAWEGNYSFQVVTDTARATEGAWQYVLGASQGLPDGASGTTYTYSTYILAPAGTPITLAGVDFGANGAVYTSSGTATGGWDRYSITLTMGNTPHPTLGNALQVGVKVNGTLATTFYIDGSMLEKANSASTWVVGGTTATPLDLSAVTGLSGDGNGNAGTKFTTPVTRYMVSAAALNGSYLRLNGLTTGEATAPDSAALSITGSIDIRVRVALDNWTNPAAVQYLAAKYASTSTCSYAFYVDTAGNFNLRTSANGSTLRTATSTVVNGITNGATMWVRATRDSTTGTVQFFTAADSASVPSVWTQLGANISTTIEGLFDGTQLLEIGNGGGTSNWATGNIYRVVVLNGIAGTTAFDANFTTQSAGTASFTESSTNAATVTVKNPNITWASTNSWSASSGGSSGASIPLIHDAVNINAASVGSTSMTITVDQVRIGKDIDFSAVKNRPTLSFNAGGAVTVGGNWNQTGTTNGTYNNVVIYNGRGGIQTLTTGGVIAPPCQIQAGIGSYKLMDNMTLTSATGVNSLGTGELNLNGFALTTPLFNGNNGQTKVLTFNNGKIIITGLGIGVNGTPYTLSATATTIGPSAGQIVVGDKAAVTPHQLSWGNNVYTNIDLIIGRSTPAFTFNQSPTFRNVVIDVNTISVQAGQTFTVTGYMTTIGRSSSPITISSATPGTPVIFALGATGIWSQTNNVLTDITVTGNIPVAAHRGTNVSGNTGFNFSAIRPNSVTRSVIGVTRARANARTLASTRTGAS